MASSTTRTSPFPTYGLRGLFAAILLAATALGWYVDRSRLTAKLDTAESKIRQSKLQLRDRLDRPDAVGQPVINYPGLTSLADAVYDETMEDFKFLPESLRADKDGMPFSDCHIYAFMWNDELAEGHVGSFTVTTSDHLIVHVYAPYPSF